MRVRREHAPNSGATQLLTRIALVGAEHLGTSLHAVVSVRVQRENRRVKTRPRTVTRVPRAHHISLISALGESVPAARRSGFKSRSAGFSRAQ